MVDINEILELSINESKRHAEDKILLQPVTYIEQTPDKDIVLKFMRAFNHWLKIPLKKFELISKIVHLMHNASSLTDDMQGKALLRGGRLLTHPIYGLASVINAGTYASMQALEMCHLLDHPEALKVFLEHVSDLHRALGVDIKWRETFKIPTEFELKLMAVRKYGGLYRMALSLMQLFSPTEMDFDKLIVLLGVYTQIWDDYCNLSDDITASRFGFPLVHAVQNDKVKKDVLDILKQRTSDMTLKKRCRDLLVSAGSLKYTESTLELLDTELRKEVARLGSNSLMEEALNKLLLWNIHRKG